eukprot:s2228_g8.t3
MENLWHSVVEHEHLERCLESESFIEEAEEVQSETLASGRTDASAAGRLQLLSMLGVVAFTLASITAATSSVHVCFLSFLLFEFCVGIYFPSVGTVKSELERIRATMYNICRVPLNAIVVGLLLTNLSVLQCFRFCAMLLGIVFLASLGLQSPSSLEESPETFSAKMKSNGVELSTG